MTKPRYQQRGKSSRSTLLEKPISGVLLIREADLHIKFILQWYSAQLFTDFTKHFYDITSLLKSNNHFSFEWGRALNKLENDLNERFSLFSATIFGGMQPVSIGHLFLEQSKQQLLNLKPIQVSDLRITQETPQGDFQGLITEFKDEIKKGNRASFKLLQELLTKFDEFSEAAGPEVKKEVVKSVQDTEKKSQELINLAIQAVDAMDLIYQSAMKTELKEWGIQIEKVINDYIKLLETYGIEEIKVLGEFINGETMISIGTVPESFQSGLQKFQVYAIHERGFRYKETGQLIREAKVITIY